MVRLEELKIGQFVVDHATKAKGVITARCDHISGFSQFVVQLPESDGKVPEAFALDWQSFEILDDNLVKNTITPEIHSFNLGDKIESLDNGVRGNIIRFWTYVNGCVLAAIALPLTRQGEAQETVMVPINRIKLVKAAIATPKPRKQAGPATRCPR
jgi:hypothetical protein